MTPRRAISLITATPPGFNPGMLASQLAARWFVERHQLTAVTTFYRVIPLEDRLAHLGSTERESCLRRLKDGIEYRVLAHSYELDGTIPFYWGDLLHMRHYLDSIRLLLNPASSTPEALLLLADAPEQLVGRAVSVGTSFLYHTGSDLSTGAYAGSFQRFVESARLVLPRDIVSTAQLGALAPQMPLSVGIDVTQTLCGRADWRDAFHGDTDRSIARDGVLLCHFARGKHDVSDLRHAVELLSQRLKVEALWMPWGDSLSFPEATYQDHLGLPALSENPEPQLSALFEAIVEAACVITDTYHVAVIAWSLGTPAVMVRGDYWSGDFNAVVDKRYVFYVQHGLQEFCLESARNRDVLPAVMDRLADLVASGDITDWYTASVRNKAEWIERRVLTALAEESAS